jgi:preprotein translocase SecE subunit
LLASSADAEDHETAEGGKTLAWNVRERDGVYMAGEELGKGSVIQQSGGFFRGAMDELKKIHYPTKQEAIQATISTITMMVFFAVVLSLLDLLFRQLMLSVLA